MKPVGQAGSRPIREQVNGSASIGIHQDRAVALAAPLAPIIDAQHMRRSHRWQRRPFEQPEQRCSTGQHALPARQPCPGLSAQGTREREQTARQRLRPPSPRRSQYWSLLGEDAPRTAPVGTEEAADSEVQADAAVGPGQVSQCALVATVDPMRSAGTARIARGAMRAGEFKVTPSSAIRMRSKRKPRSCGSSANRKVVRCTGSFLTDMARQGGVPCPEPYRHLFQLHRN
jgi:hypothetical protein